MRCRALESGVALITQPYHINGSKGYNYDHWGIDLTDFSQGYSALGWIVAHSNGVVVGCRNNCTGFEYNSYGNYVLIKHPNGMYTMYAHLSYNTVQVYVGQTVYKGQRLGYMGNTGTSYGGHLHFEVRQSSGYQIDPEPYLNSNLPGMSDKNWVYKNGFWYLYDANGNMLYGWQKVGGEWYFLNSNGTMKIGWLYDKSYKGWFYFSSKGAMQTGWQKVSNKWYYLATATNSSDIKGKMKVGWVYINGNWYYLQEKADSSHKEGEMRIGWLYDKTYKGWFYLDNSGAMQTGWQKINGKWYYLNPVTLGSNIKGKMYTGWLTYKGKKYYLNPKQTLKYKEGEMFTGVHKINGKTYTFDSSGALIK